MGQQGIYVAPCNSVPNRDRIDTRCTEANTQKLWIIEFEIKGVGNGCSVVKSPNAKGAEVLLKTQGTFNGTPIDASNVVSTAKGSSSKGIMNVVYGE